MNAFIIHDVNPIVFQMMLRTMYGRRILPEEWRGNDEEFYVAVNKYGFSNLKKDAELWYAKLLECNEEEE